jgi:hypothetical protein
MIKNILTKSIRISLIAALLLIIGFLTGFAADSNGKDLVIKKSEINSTVKFFPYRSGGINMEILAVKAPDGTIRTAFNTCQVCYNSGRGYYIQEGDVVVCQNCGNRFRLDQIEKVKGGCNPVPIVKENKIETKDSITISAKFIAQFHPLFVKWKKR